MSLPLTLSTLILVLVGSVVGLRLLVVARRTRQLPELAVGLGLFSYAFLAQGGRFLSEAVGGDAAPELRIAVLSLRMLGFFTTLAGLSIFTWRVFGADSRWRRVLAGSIVLVGFVSSVAILWHAWIQFSGGALSPAVWRSVLSVAFLATFAWTSSEALRYYGLMRRRFALGLADAVVVNRFLIWGGGAAISTALTVAPVLISLAGEPENAVSLHATTVAGLVNAGVWWLSFMPPRAYLRWVEQRSRAPVRRADSET